MHRTLRASARGVAGRRRGALMASLLPFSSSGLAPKPSPPSAAPAPPPASATARPPRPRLLLARAAARRDPEPAPPFAAAAEERKSLAVRTGELFLGLAALLVRAGRGAAAVEEVEEREGVVWEQRPEDVEAERERQRREVATASPGFSFSAAGLLFPYHLGVAQCLLDRGYITERTPLAGSSAGAIICAVIASGITMQDALQVTKVLAETPLTLQIYEFNSKVMQDELQRLGFKVNHHEDNIRFLKSEINAIEELSVDLGIKLGNYYSSVAAIANNDTSVEEAEQRTIQSILNQDKTAAGIRLLSEYLGMDNMLGLVCKTYDGAKGLETYDN